MNRKVPFSTSKCTSLLLLKGKPTLLDEELSPLKLTTSLGEPSLLATKRQGEHQEEGLSHLLITPSLRSWSTNFFAGFSIPAGDLGHVVLFTGLAPGLTLILMGATLAKEEGSTKKSEDASG